MSNKGYIAYVDMYPITSISFLLRGRESDIIAVSITAGCLIQK